MKQTFALTILTVLVSAPAFAQDCPQFELRKMSRAQAVRQVATVCNANIQLPEDGIDGSIGTVTVFEGESADSVLQRLLYPQYDFDKVGDTYVVRPRNRNDPALGGTLPPQTSTTRGRAATGKVAQDRSYSACGGVWGPDHGLPLGYFHIEEDGRAVPATCGEENAAIANNLRWATSPQVYHFDTYSYAPNYPAGWSGTVVGSYGSYPMYGTGYYGGYIPPWLAAEPCRNFRENRKCTMGELKIDGPELPEVDMYLTRLNAKDYPGYDEGVPEGEPTHMRKNLGVVSKHNSWYNKPFKTQIGWYRIEFVRKDTDIVLYTDTVEVLSEYQMDGEPTHYRVDNNRFENEVNSGNILRSPSKLTADEWQKQGRPR